ncbi:uncharacterized protein LOC107046530 isoform X2 [Diachasma alloeum]|nr:uncharacterized protein LOC107046530 isoform X2 [Diachasma alloeum]
METGIIREELTKEEVERSEPTNQVEPSGIAANLANYVFDDDEDLHDVIQLLEDDQDGDSDYQVTSAPKKPKKLKIVNADLTAIFDRAKLSDRMAARVLAAILIAIGITLEEVHLSPDTLRRNRRKQRKFLDSKIRENFKDRPSHILTIHWDGKQLSALEDKLKKVDRLPVLVTGHSWNQLLGIARLEKGSGELQAKAVYEYLKEWGIVDEICAMVFDTTASNTGSVSGACVLLEKFRGRDLLYLACRHHVFELLLKTAFESLMESTTGPDVSIFRRFQGSWKSMNQEEFSPGVEDNVVKQALQQNMEDDLTFAQEQLKKGNIRNDYREFLELVVLFLGGKLAKGYRFRALGPIHHARWMAKAIYSLKIFLFREQFCLKPAEKSGLRYMCIFIIRLYQKAWFTAPNPVTAPNNDLILLKNLQANAPATSGLPPEVCKAVFDKFSNHLWYLSEELIALAFFDEN